jgi:hypothetical protein
VSRPLPRSSLRLPGPLDPNRAPGASTRCQFTDPSVGRTRSVAGSVGRAQPTPSQGREPARARGPNWWRRTAGVDTGFIVRGRVRPGASHHQHAVMGRVGRRTGTALLVAGPVTDRPLNPLCATSRWTASANTAGYSPSSSTRSPKPSSSLRPNEPTTTTGIDAAVARVVVHDDDLGPRRNRGGDRRRRSSRACRLVTGDKRDADRRRARGHQSPNAFQSSRSSTRLTRLTAVSTPGQTACPGLQCSRPLSSDWWWCRSTG